MTAIQAAAPAEGDLVAIKRQLRASAMAHRRDWASAEARAAASLAACERLLAEVPLPADAPMSGFWPMGEEIDTRPLLEALHRRGHEIGLPIVVGRGQPLVFRRWQPGDVLVAASFGVMVPPPEAPVVVPRVAVTPLLAFDRQGYRLGYGGGFYDRTLALLRAGAGVAAIGFGFAAQEVEAVPRAAYDEPLDWVVTDRFALQLR